ncbi:MAG TPA: M90 family metallopeptidase [Candidatus Binatia bacterium]|nr:M90 family metallopeptidase [Candidatus Binatia bacterium]
MPLTRRGRRRQALARPFPNAWRALLEESFAHWALLDATERRRVEDLTRMLLADKYWEATHGFALTEEMRVLIAAMASLLVLGLDYDYYHRVTTVIVAPSSMVLEGARPVGQGLYTDEPEVIIGQARHDGPVLIAWEAARRDARHPEWGRNVVYHEFAHKLDMLDGGVDGTPPLETRAEHRRWVEVCQAEYERLRGGEGGELLDPYGGVTPGEFFAVVTEVFFTRPQALQLEKPELYAVLRDFYRQDPADRERRKGLPSWLSLGP